MLFDDLVDDARRDQRRDQRHRRADGVQRQAADGARQVGLAVGHEPAEVAGVLVVFRIDVHRWCS